MTTNNSEFTQQNGLSVAADFHSFVETNVIHAASLDSNRFWQAFASLVATAASGNQTCTSESVAITSDAVTIPVRACSQPVNTAWGSLYDALYNDNAIPHTAGLKPGSSINAARRDRVVRCSKDFLDKTFPLSEGSHRDAVSYMAYFQNLLIILADGSTTGLANPKQFVGKNGPADSPDSILLAHNGSHTEISFDRNGSNGSKDLAFIEDIQLETASQTLFDFDANSTSDKCSAYDNWLGIVKFRKDRTFSDRDGNQNAICDNSQLITSSGTDSQCTLVRDQQGTAVPAAVIDAIATSLIESTHGRSSATRITLCFDESKTGISDAFITELQQLLHTFTSNVRVDPQDTFVKVISISADTRAKPARQSNGTASETELVTSPTTATIGTMQSHGYDVTQAVSL